MAKGHFGSDFYEGSFSLFWQMALFIEPIYEVIRFGTEPCLVIDHVVWGPFSFTGTFGQVHFWLWTFWLEDLFATFGHWHCSKWWLLVGGYKIWR